MKKKLLTILFGILLLIPIATFADDDKLVKVYVFEAGGCPYCEQEIEYLKGLDSYGKKFTIVEKELYVDHVDWANGKDYDLGVKVANGFLDVGFEDASYQGTPFVVISDLYAASAYSTSLESVIDEAYEKGDKDIVKCYEDGKDDCLNHLKVEDTTTNTITPTNSWIIIGCTAAIIITIIATSTINTSKIVNTLNNSKQKKVKN